MQRVMVDIETLGTVPGSVITAIGAVRFDRDDVAPFSVNIDMQSCIDAGLKVDGSTVAWWLKQSDSARNAMLHDAIPLRRALLRFAAWLQQHSLTVGGLFEGELWAYPAAFDLPIIEAALRACAFTVTPWHYRAPRCLRTLAAISGVPKPSETPHEACRDAAMQAEWVKQCFAKLTVV